MNSQQFKFNFKSRVIRDEAGNNIGKSKKQPSIEVSLPVPSIDEIISLLQEDTKQRQLVLEAVSGIIFDAAKSQFDEAIEGLTDADQEISAAVLDFDKLTLEYLAAQPVSTRGATALTDEDWEVFFKDYLVTMVAATGKEEKRINNQLNLFKKPAKAKANKEILALLVDQLQIYMASSPNIEETAVCASRLNNKFSKWLKEPEVSADADLL